MSLNGISSWGNSGGSNWSKRRRQAGREGRREERLLRDLECSRIISFVLSAVWGHLTEEEKDTRGCCHRPSEVNVGRFLFLSSAWIPSYILGISHFLMLQYEDGARNPLLAVDMESTRCSPAPHSCGDVPEALISRGISPWLCLRSSRGGRREGRAENPTLCGGRRICPTADFWDLIFCLLFLEAGSLAFILCLLLYIF